MLRLKYFIPVFLSFTQVFSPRYVCPRVNSFYFSKSFYLCHVYGGLDVQNRQKSIFGKKYPSAHSRPVHLNAIAAPEFISNVTITR